jgi:hypothetical protein
MLARMTASLPHRPAPARRAALAALVGWVGLALPAAAEPLMISVDDVDPELPPPTEGVLPPPPAPESGPGSDAADVPPPPSSFGACEPAIAAAAAAHGVPPELLLAIGMVESGLTPWVLNAEGTPYFFDDAATAAVELERLRGEGTESIDVGCMQVNLRWHPSAFPDSTTALDPAANADYAGKFLLGLFTMTGSWTDAVAYYHSSAQRYQRPYVCAVAARLEEMGSELSLECLPSDELDLPQVAVGTPPGITEPTVIAPSGPQHMVRVAPASGAGPAVVRGQDAPADATDSTGPVLNAGPRVIRLR